jgi:hypothetical protein
MTCLEMDADVYGLLLFGDGATVHGMPLMNILASGVHELSAVLAIIDCTYGILCCFIFFMSNSRYIVFSLSLLPLVCVLSQVQNDLWKERRKMLRTLPPYLINGSRSLILATLALIVFFLCGASNVQLAGQLLSAKYPRIHVQTCAAHLVSLFFSDVCKKLWQFRLMLVNYRRLFCLFGSGSMHSPYTLFCSQSKNFNDGCKVGLLRAAETRMAGHMYAQIRMLQLRRPLVATISSVAYLDLKLKGFPKRVKAYILNPDMWQAAFVIQHCLFPMIKVLRLGDKSECWGMSKLVFYVHQTDKAIQKSMELLKDL